jgi:S-adenosylmethionine synthetase
MSIILTPGHIEVAESEFVGRHPDTLSTCLVADLVNSIAAAVHTKNSGFQGNFRSGELPQLTEAQLQDYQAAIKLPYGLERVRIDLSAQVSALNAINPSSIPIRVNVAGQVTVPDLSQSELEELIIEDVPRVFGNAGYFLHGDFSPDLIAVNTKGIKSQSPNLNGTTKDNRFADSCVVYGHYIREPFGIQGTFPSLVIAKSIDRALEQIVLENSIPGLRPDGKVHVSVVRENNGFQVRDIYISVAHASGINPEFRDVIREIVSHGVREFHQGYGARITVNDGGSFDCYFVNADSGISGKKDSVIVTGGIHQLGTDGIWGKCLYKASSTTIPYAFALSRAVCEATGANFASIGVYANYGQEQAELFLQELDSKYERLRNGINNALRTLPRDRDSIREVLDMKVNLVTYGNFNDVRGFHYPNKPWKAYNPQLVQGLTRALNG